MKKAFNIVLALSLLFSPINISYALPNDVAAEVKSLNINNQIKNINVVTVNLNSTDISLEVVTANDGIHGSEGFQSIINRKNPIAAINANFFDAYSSLEPYGSIIKNKKFTYLEGDNTSLLIKEGNKVAMDRFKSTIDGYLDGKTQNEWNNTTQSMDFNIFSIWYVNNLPKDNTGVYLYTPARGTSIWLGAGTAVEVIENKVTRVIKNPQQTTIPSNGYIIFYAQYAADDNYINARFKPSRTVSFNYNIIPLAENNNTATNLPRLDLNAADYMISAGPFLVKDGKSIAKESAQGFTEEKITVNRAQRSAIGITKDNKLKLVTGSNLNMEELAQVMISLGCDRAMNLDGGASSALYAKGKMITTPGRNLNTLLLVKDKSQN